MLTVAVLLPCQAVQCKTTQDPGRKNLMFQFFQSITKNPQIIDFLLQFMTFLLFITSFANIFTITVTSDQQL